MNMKQLTNQTNEHDTYNFFVFISYYIVTAFLTIFSRNPIHSACTLWFVSLDCWSLLIIEFSIFYLHLLLV
jgi:NADH:ubiquinone oxidoreductase subunit 6 (subunit J)